MQNLKSAIQPQSRDQVERPARVEAPVAANERLAVVELRGDDLFDSFAARYQVYCHERRFLDPEHYPEALETDEFDWFSSHIGVFDARQTLLGTVRLVPVTAEGLPIDLHCAYERPETGRYGEISRLAVPRTSRTASLLSCKMISLQLYRGLYQAARGSGMSSLVSAMEPSLERLVRRLHFPWRQVGPAVDYYGWVRPYALDLDELDQALLLHEPAIYELFHTPLDPAPRRTITSRPVRDLLAIGGPTGGD